MIIYEASLSIIINHHHDPWSRHVETVLDLTGSMWWQPGAGPTAVARSAVYRPRRLPARLARGQCGRLMVRGWAMANSGGSLWW